MDRYKENNSDPEELGQYISASANSATFDRQRRGYLVWDIEDGSLRPVGTTFGPATSKVGNEELTHWIARLLSLQGFFECKTATYGDLTLVILQVEPAFA